MPSGSEFFVTVQWPGGPRRFEAHVVNVVSQSWLTPKRRGISLEPLARLRGVPFPRSLRCAQRWTTHNVSFGVFKRSIGLRRTVAGIRSSGVVTHAGARTAGESLLAAHVAALVFVRDVGLDVTVSNFQIKNVVTVCNLNVPVSLRGLERRLGADATYEPVGERKFPMVRFPKKPKKAPCRSSISKNGIILVVGSPRREDQRALLRWVIPRVLLSAPNADDAPTAQLPWTEDRRTSETLKLLPPTVGMFADVDDRSEADALKLIAQTFRARQLRSPRMAIAR